MNRSPAEIRDRWLNYGRRYARYPTLWDSSLAFASGPLAPEAGTLQDYSDRTAGAVWSVGVGDVPKYVQGNMRGGSFWAGSFDGSNDYADAGSIAYSATGFCASCWVYSIDLSHTNLLLSAYNTLEARYFQHILSSNGAVVSRIHKGSAYIGRRTPTSYVSANRWQHILMNWSGGATSVSVEIWIDGVRADSANSESGSFSSPITSAIASKIGAQSEVDSATLMDGHMAGASLLRRSVSPAEISILATHPLAAFEVDVPRYWSFATSTHLWPWQIRRSRRVRGHR